MTKVTNPLLLAGIAILLFLPGCSRPVPYTKDILLMDTFVRIEISGKLDASQKSQAIDNAVLRMKELENKFDYFSGDSELTKLNNLIAYQIEGGKKVELLALSPELAGVLRRAEDLRKASGGAFDVRMGKRGKINLGGIAKGFIVDEGIRVLKESGVKNAIINAGGDMYCMGNGLGNGWRVGIRDPEDSRKVMARFRARDKGIATSGSYERSLHIIDPRTGYPVDKISRSVTVLAGDCTTADGLATALYVLGPEEGLALIERIDGTECVIVDDGEMHISEGFPQIALTKIER